MSENGNGKSPVQRLVTASDEKSDTRICYGATCTWWGTIYEIGTRVVGGGQGISRFGLDAIHKSRQKVSDAMALPCCPVCKGMLMEIDSMQRWDEGVAKHEKTHPGYTKFVAWMRGKCYRSLALARDAYIKETGAILTW